MLVSWQNYLGYRCERRLVKHWRLAFKCFAVTRLTASALLAALLQLAVGIAPASASTATPTVDITIETDIYNYALQLLNGRDIGEFTEFDKGYCQRDIVEFILVQKALRLAGFALNYHFVMGNYDARNLKLVANGMLLLSFDTVWWSQANAMADKVYISSPMIDVGDYEAGIFVAKDHIEQFHVHSLTDLRKLSFVSSRDWLVDWQTLSDIRGKPLTHEGDWIAMAKMVNLGWVDAMLIPFTTTAPYVYQGPGYQLQALPNVKIALNDSRHFVVSKQHPLGEQTFAALQRGLQLLRERGEIRAAYQKCGFLNADVASWTVLNQSLLRSPKPVDVKATPISAIDHD